MVHKKFNDLANLLRQELMALRKGSGLTVDKLVPFGALHTSLAQQHGQLPETFTIQQAYNALLNEISKLPNSSASLALGYAYGIDHKGGSLSARRQDLARLINKHTDTIERYENQAIAQLAAALHLGRTQAGRAAEEPEAKPLVGLSYDPAAIVQRESLKQAATSALGGLLQLPYSPDKLIASLQGTGTPYLDTDVAIEVRESSRGPNWCTFGFKYSFGGSRDNFSVAIVFEIEDGEKLIAAGLVNEYSVIQTDTESRREARSLINATTFTAQQTDSGRVKQMPFTVLDDLTTEQMFSALDQPLVRPCWIMRATIPEQWRGENIRYTYETSFNTELRFNYMYWYSPGLMYLRSLTWNYSQLAASRPPETQYRFIPHLGSPGGSTYVNANQRLDMKPDSWILRGHGLTLVWI